MGSLRSFHVLSIPIKAQPWQVDLMQKRMNLCCSVYNRLADELEQKYAELAQGERYAETVAIIRAAYTLSGEEREAAKKKQKYEHAVRARNRILLNNGITAYGCKSRAIEIADEYKPILPTRVAHFSIGEPLWTAWHKYLIGQQTSVKRKKSGDIRTLTADGRSGIRILDAQLRTKRDGIDLSDPSEKAYIIFGKQTGKRVLLMPLVVSPKDLYLIEMLRYPLRRVHIVMKRDKHDKPCLWANLLIDTAAPKCPAKSEELPAGT